MKKRTSQRLKVARFSSEELNKALKSKRSEPHYNPKTDYVRSKEKQTTKKTIEDDHD